MVIENIVVGRLAGLLNTLTVDAGTNPVQEVLLYVLIPMAAIVAGSIAATFLSPGPTIRSCIQHFAAGVVFYAVAVELLPRVIREKAPLQVVIGFSAGVALMLAVRWFTQKIGDEAGQGKKEQEEGPNQTLSLVVVVGLDLLIDGGLIGLGFAVGAKEGLLLTIALTIEILFLGLSVTSALSRAGVLPGRAIAINIGLALLIGLGGVIGATLLGGLSGPALEVVLSFGVAALLYLVTEELLVEAHEEPETPLTTTTFFAGFLLFLIIGLLA